jgi:transcriptional regulator with XRE-family HTH domain
MDFGQRLKEIRKRNGLTQDAMAERLHVTRQAVSNWENNRNLPDLAMILQIAEAFSLSLDELILGENHTMNNMTEKLIDDGSEGRRARRYLKIAWIGAVLIVFGLLCFLLKGMTVEYIDAQGILHENFFLLPIGAVLLASGAVTLLASGIASLLHGRKSRRKRERPEN